MLQVTEQTVKRLITNANIASSTPRYSDLSPSEINRLKWKMIEVAREICPEFRVIPEQAPVLQKLFNYCMCLPDNDIDPAKGLWIHGTFGTGKSTLLQVVKRFGAMVRNTPEGYPYTFRITSAPRVALDFSDNGYSGIATYCENRFQAFDDLGSEPSEVKHFGNAADPLGYILTSRYNTRRYDFTHVTTNLTVAEAAGRYGIRVADRLYEMFNIIHLPGNSFRTSPRTFL